MTEEWRQVEGWAGYEVSDLGRVRSWKRIGAAKVDPVEPRILRAVPYAGKKGNRYLGVALTNGAKVRQSRTVHTLVLEAFVGPRPEGCEGAHDNGNRRDNRLTNLLWKTPVQNAADKRAHGTYHFGQTVNCSKLTDESVRAIRLRLATGELHKTIAADFGVDPSNIYYIKNNRTWKHAEAQI